MIGDRVSLSRRRGHMTSRDTNSKEDRVARSYFIRGNVAVEEIGSSWQCWRKKWNVASDFLHLAELIIRIVSLKWLFTLDMKAGH